MRGIDGLVAAAILLVVTLAGGLLIYNYVMNYLSLPQQYANLKVASADVTIVSDSKALLSVQVVNMGNAPANVTAVVLTTSNGAFELNCTGIAGPGRATSLSIEINNQTVIAGVKSSPSVFVSLKYVTGSESRTTEPTRAVVEY